MPMGGLDGRGLRGARARRWAAATAVVTLAAVVSSGAAHADTLVQTVEAESMTLPGSGAAVVADPGASGGQVVRTTTSASVAATFTLTSATTYLTVRVRGEYCRGNWPRLRVYVDGSRILNELVSNTQLADRQITSALAAGSHQLSYTVSNPSSSSTCARAVSIDVASFFAPGTPPPPVPTVSLAAQPATVTTGQQSTLTWSSTNASSCEASGAWSGTRATSGQEATGALATGQHTYTLTCSGPGGQAAQSVTVTAQDTPPPPVPTVSLAAQPATVTTGQQSTLTWSSTNASSCEASGAWSGTRATSGQEATGALATGQHTYTLTCSGPGGQAAQSVTVTAQDAPPATPLLPDLDPAAPTSIQATSGAGGVVYLTFVFSTDNVGTGPLILNGYRASTAQAAMTVDQEIKRTDGTSTTVPNVGLFTWMDQTGYRRWGFQYQVYELRQASDSTLVRTASPEGLCVIDTTSAPGSYPGEPSAAVHTGCGNQEPTRLTLQEGLSVGWRNRHSAGKLGQLIDITTLPSGTYVLVQRVNASGLLHESSTANNASSARIEITWVTGQALPTVQVLQSCSTGETCGP